MKVTLILTCQLLVLTLFGQDSKLISLEGIGSIKIGDSQEELTAQLNIYEHSEFDGMHYYHVGQDIHLTSWTYQETDFIRGLGTESEAYQLSNGLRVGSTIEEILEVYPDLQMQKDMETYMEYFAPDELEGSFDNKRRVIIFILDSEYPKLLGNYELSSEYKTSNFSTQGRIHRIEVYNWN